MTDDSISPETHAALAEALAGAGSPASAAEVHGIASGVACARGAVDGSWRTYALGDMPPPDLVDRLTRLFHRTESLLREGEIDFNLLLPGDSAALADRVAALGDWCRGFLLGFGMARGDAGRPGDEVAEVLDDFGHIAEAMPDDEDDEDSDRALAELTEYVRVGVQLVYEEMSPGTTRPSRH